MNLFTTAARAFSALLLAGSVECLAVTPFGIKPTPPPPPEPGPPNCPMALLGQVNGSYYYATSNCADETGYAQSPDEIPVPQCNNGSCGQTVGIFPGRFSDYIPVVLAPQQAAQRNVKPVIADDVNAWIKAVTDEKTRIERAVNARGQADDRRTKLNTILPFVNQTLAYLSASDVTIEEKRAAWTTYQSELATHTKAMSSISLLRSTRIAASVKDAAVKQPLRTSAETQFTVNRALTGYTVTVGRLDPIKVETRAQSFAYFQCFELIIEQPQKQPVSLKVGVQVRPDGIANSARAASISERGTYAARVIDQNNPVLVSSVDSLEP